MSNGTADSVLTTGIVGNIVLWASGADIGEVNKKFIIAKGYEDMVARSKDLIERFGDKVKYPIDVACQIDGNRVDIDSSEIPNESIFDIGEKTIAFYAKEIRNAKYIFANGPAGVFEDPQFAMGTEDLINAMANSDGFTLIGGGHIAAATAGLGLEEYMSHLSSGGGACISMLAGKELAAVEALKNSKD